MRVHPAPCIKTLLGGAFFLASLFSVAAATATEVSFLPNGALVNESQGNNYRANSGIVCGLRQAGWDKKIRADQLRMQADHLVTLGKYSEAQALLQEALAMYQAVLEPDNPIIVLTINDIAQQYFYMGDLKASEQYYKLLLLVSQSSFNALSKLESDDKDIPAFVGTELNNIAALYSKQGKWQEAAAMLERALEIQARTVGTADVEYARTLNNLGVVSANENDYEKANQYYCQALKSRKDSLGVHHKDYALSLHNLGRLRTCQGKHDEAKGYLFKALAIRKEILGEDHPEIAASYFGIGELYSSQANETKAIEYQTKALAMRLNSFGERNPEVAASYFALGTYEEKLGNKEKAYSYYAKALKIRETVLGTNHRDTLKTMVAVSLLERSSLAVASY
jgi:tetratricopeptide (TPR) repeat protein